MRLTPYPVSLILILLFCTCCRHDSAYLPVQVTDVNVTVSYDSTLGIPRYNIDVDRNGTMDFCISDTVWNGAYEQNRLLKISGIGSAMPLPLTGGLTPYGYCPHYSYAFLGRGVILDQIRPDGYSLRIFFRGNCQFLSPSFHDCENVAIANTSGYIGLKLIKDHQEYFGWLKVSRGTNSLTIEKLGFPEASGSIITP